LEPAGPLPVVVDVIENPTLADVSAAEAGALGEAMYLETKAKHYSVAEIEAEGLGLKFLEERATADGSHRVWKFEFESVRPLPVVVDVIENPTLDQVNAAAAALQRRTRHQPTPPLPRSTNFADCPLT
jgi:hypothetical protein